MLADAAIFTLLFALITFADACFRFSLILSLSFFFAAAFSLFDYVIFMLFFYISAFFDAASRFSFRRHAAMPTLRHAMPLIGWLIAHGRCRHYHALCRQLYAYAIGDFSFAFITFIIVFREFRIIDDMADCRVDAAFLFAISFCRHCCRF